MNINIVSGINAGINVESKDFPINNEEIIGCNKSEIDTYEHNLEQKEVLPCENYNNMHTYAKKKKLIDNIQYNYSRKITLTARESMEQYYNGNITEEELKNSYKNCCALYLDMLCETGEDFETNEAKEQAVMRAFSSFQNTNCTCAMFECDRVGEQLARQYGYTGEQNIDFLYYDADVYYKSKEIEETLTGIVQSMFSEYGLENLNAEKKVKELEETTPRVGGLTFNSRWADSAEYGANIGNMTAITEEPPAGFRFFCKVNQTSSIADATGAITLDSQKGIMIVWNGEKEQKVDIPFNGSTSLGELAQIFNAAELYGQVEDYDSSILEYLRYFNIYTRTYSFTHRFI